MYHLLNNGKSVCEMFVKSVCQKLEARNSRLEGSRLEGSRIEGLTNRILFLGSSMRKFDKMSPRPIFTPNYCRAVAEDAIKSLVFMYHEAMSIFLGSIMS